jgi:hypothetical protein
MTLIRDINNILQYGKKTTSYKFATLLGIFDYITEHPTEPPVNNLHFIPIVFIAKQFISYYYPFSFYNYYQGSLAANKQLKIINYIDQFKSAVQKENNISNELVVKIQTLKESGIFWINRLYELPDSLPESLLKLLWNIRERILLQPLNYLHNVNGEIIRFFSMINSEVPFNLPYDTHRVQATKQTLPPTMTWGELLQVDKTALIIDDLTYQELARYRFWARDVILKAWFNYSLEGEKRRSNAPNIDIQLYKLLGYVYFDESSRDPTLISQYRNLYSEIGALICIYSSNLFQPVDYFHLDHLLPWTYYPMNRFWNLYPCEPFINLKKSNLIPEWTQVLEKNIRKHIKLCLLNKEHPLIENDLHYYYIIMQKNKEFDVKNREIAQIEEEMILFLKQERENLLTIIPGHKFKYASEDMV